MSCRYCGASNPEDATYCSACAKRIPTDPVPIRPSEHEPTEERLTLPRGHRWIIAYGWLALVTGLYLLFTAGLSLVTDSTLTPPPGVRSQTPIVPVSGLIQGLLFAVNGVAVIRRSRHAYKLTRVVTILAAFGVLFRGLVPVDIVVWLLQLGVTIWLGKHQNDFPKRPQVSADIMAAH